MKFAPFHFNLQQKQTTNIVMITFWSQFASYALNTILILFLTRPLLEKGLGYSQAKAYAFIGITQATGYLMPIFGGYIADNVLGLRRSILLGSILLAIAYLLVTLSGESIGIYQDRLFLMAYALVPAANSLLIGTASGMVSHIYTDDAIKAKSAMTFYYMAINVGALLATLIAPSLLDSRYGPLSVLTLTFVGKAIAALNFAVRYRLYDNVIYGRDIERITWRSVGTLMLYLIALYSFTLFAYAHIWFASIVITIGACLGIGWFLLKTLRLKGDKRQKQLLACLLTLEAIAFFVIYNQMGTTLIMFAKYNSDANLFGLTVSPAHYQILNPLLIIILGMQLPRFYNAFPKFSIPYQFACGSLLAGVAMLIMALAAVRAHQGIASGNYIAITYIFITLAELWVSAIGLSMIGLYCDNNALGFAMGVWYLACSLSGALSGRLAVWVAIPEKVNSPLVSLPIYLHYYLTMGIVTCLLGGLMLIMARHVQGRYAKRGIFLT